jgi:hypothetical protein
MITGCQRKREHFASNKKNFPNATRTNTARAFGLPDKTLCSEIERGDRYKRADVFAK